MEFPDLLKFKNPNHPHTLTSITIRFEDRWLLEANTSYLSASGKMRKQWKKGENISKKHTS